MVHAILICRLKFVNNNLLHFHLAAEPPFFSLQLCASRSLPSSSRRSTPCGSFLHYRRRLRAIQRQSPFPTTAVRSIPFLYSLYPQRGPPLVPSTAAIKLAVSLEMAFRRILPEVSRQHSQLRRITTLFPISCHASQKFGGNAGTISKSLVPCAFNYQEYNIQPPACSMMLSRALYSADASLIEVGPTDSAKELHDKLLKAIKVQKTAPPNNWLWTIIEKCANREDIKLLFNVLENLRKFRLSNLRIFENFNDNLCREVSKACVRVEAIDFAKKTLWKHNVYGLTPSVASAHNILLYAKQHNDVNLVVDVMKLLKANNVPLQPGTADIIFSICYNTDCWDLMLKYAKRFLKSGVKLRRTSFDTLMTFAAKLGDVDNLWKIEKLRSGLMKTHTIGSGFSCAKGFLLEGKPEEAAAVIHVVTKTLPEAKKPEIIEELEKLVSEWPLEVIKRQKDEVKMALAARLQEDIPLMIDSLSSLGVKANTKMDDLTKMPL